MPEHSISFEEAQENLLKCAVYLAETIGSRESRAAVMETLIPHFTAKNDVDTAASLADSVDDPFIRDRLLSDVVSKCAELGDDEYAFQLIEAIDEHTTRNNAREKFALQKSAKGEFDEAFKLAESLDHASDAFAGIAVNQFKKGFDAEARQTLERVDFYSAKVGALHEIAHFYMAESKPENAVEMLDHAAIAAEKIEFTEDKIRSMLHTAANYAEAGQNDKAIAVYGKTRDIVDALEGVHKDNLFVQVAIGFLKAGSVDLADRTLDLVFDKTQIADCLIGFSQIYRLEKESDEAIHALEEAYAMLKSQTEREIRDTKARLQLFSSIAKEFAFAGKIERGIEVAHENADETLKNQALTNIAQICILADNDGLANQAMTGILEDSGRIPGLIAMSDAYISEKKMDKALETLEKVASMAESITQHIFRSEVIDDVARRFYHCGEADKARALSSENLATIGEIRGTENRAVALADLSETYDKFAFELSDDDKAVIKTFVRTSDW